MKQRIPDFFLIKDVNKRKNAEKEFKKDHNLSEFEFKHMLSSQYQLEGDNYMKGVMTELYRVNDRFREIDVIHMVNQVTKVPISKIKSIAKTIKEKNKNDMELK